MPIALSMGPRQYLDFNQVSSHELEYPNEDQDPRPNNGELAVPRPASRQFDVRTATFEMEWPEPSQNAYLQTNLYTYYQHYTLACPGCGLSWCTSRCSRPPDQLWSIRARWCEWCMKAYVEWQARIFEGRMISSQHCPGTVLSFDDRLLHEGADHDTWEAAIMALPKEWRHREILLWCRFDSQCHPTEQSNGQT